jgi:hypothetical protein
MLLALNTILCNREQLAAQNWYMLYNVKSAAHTYSKAKNAHSTPLQQTNDTTIGA